MFDFVSILGVNPDAPDRVNRFDVRSKVVIHGVDHKPTQNASTGVVMRRMDDTNASILFTQRQLNELLNTPGAVEVHPHFYSDESAKDRANNRSNLHALPDNRMQSIITKEMWVLAVLQAESVRIEERALARRNGVKPPRKFSSTCADSLRKELPEIQAAVETRMKELYGASTSYKKWSGLKKPSASAIAGWVRKFEQSGRDPLSLADNYATRILSRFDPEVQQIVNDRLQKCLTSNKTNLKLNYELLVEAVENVNLERSADQKLRCPSYESFRTRWNAIPAAVRDRARLGDEAANSKWSAVRRGQRVLRPLEVVQLDEFKTTLRAIYVNAGTYEDLTDEEKKAIERTRLWITAAIDVATCCFVSLTFHLRAPSTNTALTTLEMTTVDKTFIGKAAGCVTPWDMYGTIEEIALDSATWLASLGFRVAANDLGATMFLPMSGDASMRGTVERVFSTSAGQMFAFFTGQTGRSVQDKGKYKPDEMASVLADDAAQCGLRYIVDGYHNRPHDGLNGATPRQKWLELEQEWGVLPPPTPEIRRGIFGVQFDAKVGRHGIQKNGLLYHCRQLRTHFRRHGNCQVTCRLDRHDLGQISVWISGAWVKADCQYEELKGVTLVKWVAVCEKLRLFNREQTSVSRKVFRKTLAYLEEQGELMRISAGIPSPLMDDRMLLRLDRALDRGFLFDDEKPAITTVPLDGEWRPTDDFFGIMGINKVVYAKRRPASDFAEPARPGTDASPKRRKGGRKENPVAEVHGDTVIAADEETSSPTTIVALWADDAEF